MVEMLWRQYRFERHLFWRNPSAAFFNFLLPLIFLALFGAPLADPKAAMNALASGHAMLAAVDRWNAARPAQSMRVGIGIHIGDAVTGTVGSPQRKEYTVIGDAVNLAARLEQLTKETGARLLVSDPLRQAAMVDDATDLGPMPIRGYSEPVRVWRLA